MSYNKMITKLNNSVVKNKDWSTLNSYNMVIFNVVKYGDKRVKPFRYPITWNDNLWILRYTVRNTLFSFKFYNLL